MTIFNCKGVCLPPNSNKFSEFEVVALGLGFAEAESNAILKMRFSRNCREIRVTSISIDESCALATAETS